VPFVRAQKRAATSSRPSHPAPNARDDRVAPLFIEAGRS
jgi:hypothetical protein